MNSSRRPSISRIDAVDHDRPHLEEGAYARIVERREVDEVVGKLEQPALEEHEFFEVGELGHLGCGGEVDVHEVLEPVHDLAPREVALEARLVDGLEGLGGLGGLPVPERGEDGLHLRPVRARHPGVVGPEGPGEHLGAQVPEEGLVVRVQLCVGGEDAIRAGLRDGGGGECGGDGRRVGGAGVVQRRDRGAELRRLGGVLADEVALREVLLQLGIEALDHRGTGGRLVPPGIDFGVRQSVGSRCPGLPLRPGLGLREELAELGHSGPGFAAGLGDAPRGGEDVLDELGDLRLGDRGGGEHAVPIGEELGVALAVLAHDGERDRGEVAGAALAQDAFGQLAQPGPLGVRRVDVVQAEVLDLVRQPAPPLQVPVQPVPRLDQAVDEDPPLLLRVHEPDEPRVTLEVHHGHARHHPACRIHLVDVRERILAVDL